MSKNFGAVILAAGFSLYRIETLSKKGLRDRIMTYLRIQADKNGEDTVAVNMSRQ